MPATQASIFDAPITHGTHRKADPPTSIAAARKDRTGLQAEVLDALVAAGGRGTLDTVCDALPTRLRSSLSRRLTDLRDSGVIRMTDDAMPGHYGQPVAVWEVTRDY